MRCIQIIIGLEMFLLGILILIERYQAIISFITHDIKSRSSAAN